MKQRLFIFFLTCCITGFSQSPVQTEVLVIGGGTGGTAAGIQSARLGAKTIIVESSPWLGGMISAAGVSAVDGNHRLPSGLWAEFRSRIYTVYGGPKAVETGWVSNTLFEPHVADSIFKNMAAAEQNLSVLHHYRFQSVVKKEKRISAARFIHNRTGAPLLVQARMFIDATELGDVVKAAELPYDLGMEAGAITGENVGVAQSSNVVQDLTYVAVLKDYGAGADKTIEKPAGYDPAEFDAACTDYYIDKSRKAPSVNGQKMLAYGRLPQNKYMINWPIYGNDTYLNVVELSHDEREKTLGKAKATTLRFVYFIQQQLGFKHLGLADDEFPTTDRLALMPYHREGRRVHGLVRFTMRHIAEPYTYGDPLYRTGIAVGDYPIDHHHKKNPEAPQHLEFYPVPSFTVPLGALIPHSADNLIVAEKGISVSNVANGTTRLQPCVLLTGQAAGALAALSSQRSLAPQMVPVRSVQEALLQAKAYILPYIDVDPGEPYFEAVQKVGATGILKGRGIAYKWANQTWFYPDSLVATDTLASDLNQYKPGNYVFKNPWLTIAEAMDIGRQLAAGQPALKQAGGGRVDEATWKRWGLSGFDPGRFITRAELAVLLHHEVNPFAKPVNYNGRFIQ